MFLVFFTHKISVYVKIYLVHSSLMAPDEVYSFDKIKANHWVNELVKTEKSFSDFRKMRVVTWEICWLLSLHTKQQLKIWKVFNVNRSLLLSLNGFMAIKVINWNILPITMLTNSNVFNNIFYPILLMRNLSISSKLDEK